MICSNCGEKLSDDAKSCLFCGQKIAQIGKSGSKREVTYDGTIHKCPNCGEVLKSFEAICPKCNYELRGVKSVSAVSELVAKIEKLEAKKGEEKSQKDDVKLSPVEKQQIALISNFQIPNTKEDILDFMILASSHILKEKVQERSEHDEFVYAEFKSAWKMKFEQAYDKAKICIKSDSNRAEIEQCYEKTIIQPKKIRKKNIKRVFLIVSISLAIIIASIFIITSLTTDPNAIKVGISYENVEGQYYEDVIEILEKSGFTNIEIREDGWNMFHKSGTVKKVTINGKEEFYSFSKFPADAVIVIFYYK